MLACFAAPSAQKLIPIYVIPRTTYATWLSCQSEVTQTWLASIQYRGDPGTMSLLPDLSGNLSGVVCCINTINDFWSVGHLPFALPQGEYYFELPSAANHDRFAIAWGLGSYQFTTYKNSNKKPARLDLSRATNSENVLQTVESLYYVRDLINTPTDNMGPSELADSAMALAEQYNASFKQIVGEDLLTSGYPAIYTVGRASDDAPRLLDLQWGDSAHPKVTLVGKGVCFDTGGINIKPSSGMILMKKDMAGAAHVLGLARMIMQANLPIYLRVLIPAVENAISGNAYRPGDVIKSRKGTTIEIGNTDAEGRVILADALTEAVSEKPDLLIDITTLTGAARIALGTDLPALFSNDDALAAEIIQHAERHLDPVWRLPLYEIYREALNSAIADINNATPDSYGGAITAALFLKEFVPSTVPWIHFDMMAWNLKSRPGRPQGGEAMALRGLFGYLASRFGDKKAAQ